MIDRVTPSMVFCIDLSLYNIYEWCSPYNCSDKKKNKIDKFFETIWCANGMFCVGGFHLAKWKLSPICIINLLVSSWDPN